MRSAPVAARLATVATLLAVAFATRLGGRELVTLRVVSGFVLMIGGLLSATVSADLIETIFTPPSPLHDGAVIINEGSIVAARVILPLSSDPNLSRVLGTRHRAAVDRRTFISRTFISRTTVGRVVGRTLRRGAGRPHSRDQRAQAENALRRGRVHGRAF